MTGAKLFFPHENAADLAPHIQRHWDIAATAFVPDVASRRTDLTDALCDALDEYLSGEASLAGEASLSALTHDVDATIRELARLGDPTWAGKMRDQWKITARLLADAETSTPAILWASQLDRIAAAVQTLRSLANEPTRSAASPADRNPRTELSR